MSQLSYLQSPDPQKLQDNKHLWFKSKFWCYLLGGKLILTDIKIDPTYVHQGLELCGIWSQREGLSLGLKLSYYIQAKIILSQMRALTVNVVRNPQISDIFESTVNRIF